MEPDHSEQPGGAQETVSAVAEIEVTRIHTDFKRVLCVPIQLTIELGRSKVRIGDLLDIGYHSVFETDKVAGNNLDIYVNDVLLGRGEVLIMEDRVGVKINEIVGNS